MAAEDRPPRRRIGLLLGVLGFAGFGWLFWYATVGHHVALPVAPATQPSAPQPSALQPPSPAGPASEQFQITTTRLDRDQTLGQVLPKLKLTGPEAAGVLAALDSHFPARRARTGDQLIVERRAGDPALRRLTYRQGRADEYVVTHRGGAWVATRRPVELSVEVSRISVEVKDSLYLSLRDSGEDPSLAVLASDVLAWDVDFYRDVRDGDRMTVLVEKTIADGRRLRYGEIQAIEYLGKTAGRKRLFRWTAPDGQTSYFDDDGQSARRGFLKAPLKFAHVTSGYGNRSHPLLGYQSAHTGVDYGAPPGTPVWAVGDGVVKQAGWNGGCGLSVTIRHPNGLETLYCHLSAVSVSPGKPVTQKQGIGAVGSTGLSTGPHLHYAVLRGGAYLNPGQLKVPRDAPVRAAWLPDFQSDIATPRALLDGVALAGVGPSATPTAMIPVVPSASGGGGGAPAPR